MSNWSCLTCRRPRDDLVALGDEYVDRRDPDRRAWLLLADDIVFVPPGRPNVRTPMVRLLSVRTGVEKKVAAGVFREYYELV